MKWIKVDDDGTPLPGWYSMQQEGPGMWVDDDYADALEALSKRQWRDWELMQTDYLLMPDYPLAEDKRADLLRYRQSLRDYPASPGFPDCEQPVKPDWMLK